MNNLRTIVDRCLELVAKLPDSTGLTRCAYFYELAVLLKKIQVMVSDGSVEKRSEENQNDRNQNIS